MTTTSSKDEWPLSASQEGDVCAVCIDTFTEPVTLSCGHNFCLSCAKLLVKKGPVSIIPCPLCIAETKLDKYDEELTCLMRNLDLKDSCESKRGSIPTSQQIVDGNSTFQEHMKNINKVIMPKSIKLLEEYDASIGKDGKTFISDIHTGMIGYGVSQSASDAEFQEFSLWDAMIIGPQESPIGQLIYNLEVVIPEKYPIEPPQVSFVFPKVSMPCVDAAGKVDLSKVEKVNMDEVNGEGVIEASTGELFVWDPTHNIADALIAIREHMHVRSVCVACSTLGHSQYR
mmetsp:Transcript_53488/g.88859  ORF Transcript_53488/g.88859 Transcript_53488/m.88859 type:complete len:286 (+) Transcript_53488:81-938(+)|eukprot:CAMPEP_0184355450 /NCGR_PEP_ID=MMETSP1089-20130417/96079_1 /TAXON_ID=38269 ORGANISM="Gloeochaete wittrockiana, Strain SAG46.84" /NCGR_SAMPLE_ID=MMETSP1089 /ASSEMBLY_ACC=CAM_ASM_000445 /LENGTH=285 /DNA_ID=CAMNT_0026692117 /DNA_START=34 /DNA_END=891 /DNA_ORIENTATION=-